MSLQSRLSDLITAIGADWKRAHGVVTIASTNSLTPTPDGNQFNVTALAVAMLITNPTHATINDGQSIIFRIKDNGTARGISWGTDYRGIGLSLPNTTVIGKTLYIGAKWNAADTKVDVMAIAQET